MSGTVDRIKSLMRAQNMSAAELSRAAGLNHSTVSRYLSGKVEPKKDSVKAIAKALHVSEVYLLNIEEQTGPISDLLCKYGIDPQKEIVIHQYVTMSPENQKQVENYISFLLSQHDDDSSEADK